ncbi:uncharacterized protein [Physcomitrium patens]|uniref:uncharacterized protein isoform X2 n=1 Tax=Physcomitrium patens TaxID=3218 RepID=UPI000D167E0A|nr:uncharacterized protein LOC112283204 isoform X2 [Physcomitrium patens]|eukprot:XP_024377403.1 uncharacterized protein LOC112283204 isoform X2 [Physcomitrella patens]
MCAAIDDLPSQRRRLTAHYPHTDKQQRCRGGGGGEHLRRRGLIDDQHLLHHDMAATMCSSRKLSTPPAFAHAFYTRSAASAQCASLGHISRPWELTTSNSVPALRCLRLQTGGRRGVEVRAGKGFGELLQRKRKGGAEEKLKESLGCPCGGGDERREYSDCCARYHGGVVEPDALTLMKARFSGYARSKVGYVVRTTHRENPDFGDEKTLAADVRATCERLRFTRLEILEFEETSEDEGFGMKQKRNLKQK